MLAKVSPRRHPGHISHVVGLVMNVMGSKTIGDRGLSLYSESFGSLTDPPVLLIMGAMASGVWWPEDCCHQLAGRGRFVIRYDHRDTGRSTSYEPGRLAYSAEDLADDTIQILDGFGIDAAHLVGMSLGGFLAQISRLEGPHSRIEPHPDRIGTASPGRSGDARMNPSIPEYHARARELDWSDQQAVVGIKSGRGGCSRARHIPSTRRRSVPWRSPHSSARRTFSPPSITPA